MIALYNGKCSHCGKPIPKGSEMHYVSYNKRAYHPSCANTGPEGPSDDTAQVALAVALGYEPHTRED